MADKSLIENIKTPTGFLDRTLLPGNFNTTYVQYVLQSGSDLSAAAGRANAASKGAYDAQVRNDEQDVILEDHEERITDLNERLTFVEGDYVSKTVTEEQSLASPLNVTASYSVDGVKVIGPQETGWTESTGTANKGVFDADLSFTPGFLYSQSEAQAMADALTESRQRIKALEDTLRTHGLID